MKPRAWLKQYRYPAGSGAWVDANASLRKPPSLYVSGVAGDGMKWEWRWLPLAPTEQEPGDE